MNDNSRQDERPSDQIIMKRIASGDDIAFRYIVEENIRSMTRFAINMTGNQETAEDMVQQSFTKAWQAAGKWKPQAKISTWLYTILRNECLQFIRKHKPDIRVIMETDELTDAAPLPDHILEQKDKQKTLDTLMNKLPERQRSALLLRYAEGMSQKEAAAILDIHEKALESLVSRGKEKLKLWLSYEH